MTLFKTSTKELFFETDYPPVSRELFNEIKTRDSFRVVPRTSLCKVSFAQMYRVLFFFFTSIVLYLAPRAAFYRVTMTRNNATIF